MQQPKNRKLVLESGEVFDGYGFGANTEKVLELVFNTSMVGYQEIVSDPSYTDQAVVMTYPLIGNYGVNEDDYETQTPSIGALVVREYNDEPSNFRASDNLQNIMKKYGISGICGVDTRAITRIIRNRGSLKSLITFIDKPLSECMEILNRTALPKDAVSRVTSNSIWKADIITPQSSLLEHKQGAHAGLRPHIVAIDCGMKQNILRSLLDRGCRVTVVPYNTSAKTIMSLRPDGVFISNGPGDPMDVPECIDTIRSIKGSVPIFGICLGHQILSLAYGAKTYKLKFGHRGGNHPVKDMLTDKVEITSQNHSYAVDTDSIEGTKLKVTHINLLDNTVEGVACDEDLAFSVQYHPESAPGPQDSSYLFDRFMDNVRAAIADRKENANA
ncbi:MAG: glutamine-hydrolyzing carbamoyl-phosphate synthase small subunit [Lachnospiraceae bacterium]|nr:glutamine-hydrolyzing carbamoyl-phosphate synthase small subunit [Lachnospiraceae bacterium]